jgi:hypothetical protein
LCGIYAPAASAYNTIVPSSSSSAKNSHEVVSTKFKYCRGGEHNRYASEIASGGLSSSTAGGGGAGGAAVLHSPSIASWGSSMSTSNSNLQRTEASTFEVCEGGQYNTFNSNSNSFGDPSHVLTKCNESKKECATRTKLGLHTFANITLLGSTTTSGGGGGGGLGVVHAPASASAFFDSTLSDLSTGLSTTTNNVHAIVDTAFSRCLGGRFNNFVSNASRNSGTSGGGGAGGAALVFVPAATSTFGGFINYASDSNVEMFSPATAYTTSNNSLNTQDVRSSNFSDCIGAEYNNFTSISSNAGISSTSGGGGGGGLGIIHAPVSSSFDVTPAEVSSAQPATTSSSSSNLEYIDAASFEACRGGQFNRFTSTTTTLALFSPPTPRPQLLPPHPMPTHPPTAAPTLPPTPIEPYLLHYGDPYVHACLADEVSLIFRQNGMCAETCNVSSTCPHDQQFTGTAKPQCTGIPGLHSKVCLLKCSENGPSTCARQQSCANIGGSFYCMYDSPPFRRAFTGQIKQGGDEEKCLDIAGSQFKNGAKIDIWDCMPSTLHYNRGQLWSYDNNTSQIRSLARPEFCLSLKDGVSTDGNTLELWRCDSNTQRHEWYLNYAAKDSDYLTIEYKHGVSKKCIDLGDSVYINGNPVDLWDCNGLPQQRWRTFTSSITPPPTPAPGPPTPHPTPAPTRAVHFTGQLALHFSGDGDGDGDGDGGGVTIMKCMDLFGGVAVDGKR